MVAGLIVWRDDFDTRVTLVRLALALPLCALGFVLFGFVALRDHFVPPLGAHGSVEVALLRLQFLPPPFPSWHSPGALWFLSAVPFITYGSILLALPMFIRSGNPGNPRRGSGSSGRSGQPG